MSSKSELTKTIENQQSRISRLEQRLGDVVAAYKNLQKEKEALESTVRVLTSKDETPKSEGESSSTTVDETENNSPDQKLQTLQQNLAVITEQKNRMEQMFQMDKRKLKSENDELRKSLEEGKAENIILKEKTEQEIKELKKATRECQREFERKTADHGVTVRELQTLLSAERNKIETMEHQFDECRAKVLTLENQMETLKKQNVQLNQQNQTKLNERRQKELIDLEEHKRIKQINQDLTSKLKILENEHQERFHLESKRTQQLEMKISELTGEHAERVSNYENRLAELSEQIGFVEKQRTQDQSIIQRLKERITQLDIEISLLIKTNSVSIEDVPDFETFMKHITQLKLLIRSANERFGKSLSLEEIFNAERKISMETTNEISHGKCQEEIERLRIELDKYRSKTVAAFKAKTFQDSSASKEIDDLRHQIENLREKLLQSQSLYNSENDRHSQIVDKLQSSLNNVRDQHRQEFEQLFNKKRFEINELECELEKQRERTVRLLTEKDRELETIKKQFQTSTVLEQSTSNSINEAATDLNELFPHTSSSTIGGPTSFSQQDNPNILYFVQEQQLREQELVNLRKQRYELELTIRDLHRKYSYDMNQYQINLEQLQDELERMKLTERRHQTLTENEHNIDYIKNVFYHYLLATDHQVKQTMANALMTILHFSSKEKAKIEHEKSNRSLSTTGWFSKT